MVLALLHFAAAAEQPLQPRQEPAVAVAPASASAIILMPGIGSRPSWDQTQRRRQKEVTVTEQDGSKTLIRLIEFE